MFFYIAIITFYEPETANSWPIEQTDVAYSNAAIVNKKHSIEFYSSYFMLENVVFDNNTCMGKGKYPSYGGAVFLKLSRILARYTCFNNNKAVFGGAICCIDTHVLLQNIRLSNNFAYKLGGAIYAEVQQSINTPDMNSFCLTKCEFNSNYAHSSGGALDLHDLSDVYIQNTNLYNNRAGFRGGAISCNNIKVFHFNGGQIHNNLVQRASVPFFNGKNDAEKVKFSTKWLQSKEVVKHGGAIYAYSKDDSLFKLEYCCFVNNSVQFYENNGKLNDVMIDSDKMTQCFFLNINEIGFESSGNIQKFISYGEICQEFSKESDGIIAECKTFFPNSAFDPTPTFIPTPAFRRDLDLFDVRIFLFVVSLISGFMAMIILFFKFYLCEYIELVRDTRIARNTLIINLLIRLSDSNL